VGPLFLRCQLPLHQAEFPGCITLFATHGRTRISAVRRAKATALRGPPISPGRAPRCSGGKGTLELTLELAMPPISPRFERPQAVEWSG